MNYTSSKFKKRYCRDAVSSKTNLKRYNPNHHQMTQGNHPLKNISIIFKKSE